MGPGEVGAGSGPAPAGPVCSTRADEPPLPRPCPAGRGGPPATRPREPPAPSGERGRPGPAPLPSSVPTPSAAKHKPQRPHRKQMWLEATSCAALTRLWGHLRAARLSHQGPSHPPKCRRAEGPRAGYCRLRGLPFPEPWPSSLGWGQAGSPLPGSDRGEPGPRSPAERGLPLSLFLPPRPRAFRLERSRTTSPPPTISLRFPVRPSFCSMSSLHTRQPPRGPRRPRPQPAPQAPGPALAWAPTQGVAEGGHPLPLVLLPGCIW